jgi:hypothetical protein
MSAPALRNFRVFVVGYGAYAVWVTAESRRAACELAASMLSQSRSALPSPDRSIEVLDEYEEGTAA